MKRAMRDLFGGFKSLLVGMRVTIGQFFKPIVTVQYPHETLKMPARFRGHIELVRDPSTGRAICYACKLCERACPSDCITVDGVKLEGAKKKSVSQYVLDFTKCSLCGSCVEACRDHAIQFSREYNLASLNKEDYVMDLFARLEKKSQEADAAAGIVRTPPAPAPPAASLPGANNAPVSRPASEGGAAASTPPAAMEAAKVEAK